jgi:putative inorganic carbon (HCO3(-)) transporter
VKRPPGILAASLGVAFFLLPLYPSFIGLTGAPVPGVSLVPRSLALVLLALVSVIAVYWCVLLTAMPRRPMPTLLPVAALPAAGLLAALLGFDPLAGALFIVILLFGVVAHATILRFARVPSILPTIFAAYLLSGILASMLAIALAFAHEPANLYTIGHGRAIGTFVLPGELAGYLIVYVPVALALARVKTLDLAGLAWPGIVLGSIAFVLTFSRAGWVGMAAALAVFALLRRRGRGGRRFALAIGAAAILVLALIFNAHHDPSENFSRPSIWDSALHIVSLFPLTGVGPFEFARLYPLFRTPGGEPIAYHAHSVILTIAAETGLVGLCALVFGWLRFVETLRARLRPDGTYGVVAIGIAAGLAGTWVQGLIDMVSVVIFGLWLPFMALALVCAGHERPAEHVPLVPSDPRARRTLVAVATVLVLLCGSLQFASSALFSRYAPPYSLVRHLPEQLGVRVYDALTRVVPLPLVDLYLTNDALFRRDLPTAEKYAARIPAGALASETQARVAMAQGDENRAFQLYLDAGDDEALQSYVAMRANGYSWRKNAGVREAHRLEGIIRDRLAAAGTRPNALADSWWQLGNYAARLGDLREAAADDDHAIALAPLNTKYLKEAGELALRRGDWSKAVVLFTRATEIDPSDAKAAAYASYARQRIPRPSRSP